MTLAEAMRKANTSKLLWRESNGNVIYAVDDNGVVKNTTYFELKHMDIRKIYRSYYPAKLKLEDIEAKDWNVSDPEFKLI